MKVQVKPLAVALHYRRVDILLAEIAAGERAGVIVVPFRCFARPDGSRK
jgi:hypothetical protein